MTDLEQLLAALTDTIGEWEADDAVARFAEILRRNLDRRVREGQYGADAEAAGELVPETAP